MDKSRTEILVGKENIEKIAQKNITIVGTGGVGGYTAVMLARAGVENITLIDFDLISSSNINRQIIAYESTIGKKKVDVLKDMILDINKNAKVKTIDQKLTKDNVSNLIPSADFVVDAIDSVEDKIALICFCKEKNIPIISAMGAGNRYGLPHFQVMDIYKTQNDGLAKVIRKKLRENGVEKLDVVCSLSPVQVKTEKGMVGSISYVPAMCGCVIAGEIINRIIGG